MIKNIILVSVISVSSSAIACSGLNGNCTYDTRGNSYTTEQNLNGGYRIYKNGDYYGDTNRGSLSNKWETRTQRDSYNTIYSDKPTIDPNDYTKY